MSALQEDAAIVAAMVREFDFARYAASLFAPEPKRRARLALAAFDLEIRRIPDQVSQPLPGEVRLQWWSDAIEGREHGGVAGHPVAAELLRAVDAEGWSRDLLSAAIDAHKFDLYGDPMPTLAALEVYCDDTSGGLIALACGLPTDAEPVREGGRALGLARIVAHLAHDAARGRCYLPEDLLTSCGASRAQVLAGQESEPLREARRAVLDKARRALRRARTLAKKLPREQRVGLLPLAPLDAELRMLDAAPTFAVPEAASRLRVIASEWWMMR